MFVIKKTTSGSGTSLVRRSLEPGARPTARDSRRREREGRDARVLLSVRGEQEAAYRDFGYTSITDYAQARFGFGARKTGYLVSFGRKIEHLPKIRAALASGKLGWCKASRLASVAAPENDVMWLESALSLTVRQLEQRVNIKGRHRHSP